MRYIIVALVSFIVGGFLGHVLAIWFAHEVITRSSRFYKELVLRGDAAIAVLSKVTDEIHSIGRDANKKRVILAEDLGRVEKLIGLGGKGINRVENVDTVIKT